MFDVEEEFNSERKITDEQACGNILLALYEEQNKLGSKAKLTNDLTIWMGDVGDIIRAEKYEKVLTQLKKLKIILSYKFKIVTILVSDNDSTRDDYTCYKGKCKKVSKRKLEKYMQELSLIPLFNIEIKKSREIVLNNKYLLAKPNFLSENQVIFEYLYNNPRKRISMPIIKGIVKKARDKSLKKALRQSIADLRFTGELKKIFFPNVSQNAIEFRNKIFQKDVKEVGVNEKKLKKQLENLEKWKKK